MTEKFTLRDILVYTLLGIILIFFFYIHFPFEIISIIKDSKEYSDLTILLLIPFSYVLGHLIMSLDDIIFNEILLRLFPKKKPMKNVCWKLYNYFFFGYRNIGVRNKRDIDSEVFFETCDRLISEKNYEKSEYNLTMSDLFKGIFLIILMSILFDLRYKTFEIWKLIMMILIWFRAKMFSTYYVDTIKRNIKEK